MLTTEGEPMGVEELEKCLYQLVSDGNFKTALKEQIACDDFSENVLGFEEVDEVEDEEGGEGEYGAEMDPGMTAQGGGLYNEVIPEEEV
jgi:hypothetical protein